MASLLDRSSEITERSSAWPPGQRCSFSSLRPPNPNINIVNDGERRSEKLDHQASLSLAGVPRERLDGTMMSPLTSRAKSRISANGTSLVGSETTERSPLQVQVDRRMSWARASFESFAASDEKKGRSDDNSNSNNKSGSRRPSITSRSASWDGKHVATPVRPTPLLQPQPQSAPAMLRNQPGEAFQKLPKEVLDVVLIQLRKLHLWDKSNQTCATCWMRDACSLMMADKRWATSAAPALYDSIWLIGNDSMSHIKKKFKMRYGTRLKLLRRTLRANVALANHVRELKLPDIPEGATSPNEQEAYLDLVASIVMACPNLERLLDFHQPYSHQFSRLTYALSARPRLVEHVWNIAPGPVERQSQDDSRKESRRSRYIIRPEKLLARDTPSHPPLPPEVDQEAGFLELHSNWTNLTTLVIHCCPGGIISPSLLQRTMTSLPSLAHLALSSLSFTSVNVLSGLPLLKSLHLSKVSILPEDFSTFVTTAAAQSLTSLTLAHVPLDSLPFLARLLSNLTSLSRFSLVQNHSPCLPESSSNIYLQPYLASRTLNTLTWDILHPDDGPNDATRVLAASIAAQGFPRLCTLKAPCDYDGTLQRLCRPNDRIELPSDKYAYVRASRSPDRKDSGIAGIAGLNRLDDPDGGEMGESGYTRSLRAARRAAQARIELARLEPQFHVTVEDWTDSATPVVEARFDVGAYVGTVGSRVAYDLSEDVEGKDGAGVAVEDVIIGGAHASGACDGRWTEWNIDGDTDRDRDEAGRSRSKRKEWGLHRPRPRWSPLEVARIF
ncbi:MAG: hypothetical protein M1818_005468 [Claussenomyces sp. TS43310]|nr:MAG: hypothetical protein M1818_005468 [Claussenomyces sp. TS43310]